jgi:hypothetical protein
MATRSSIPEPIAAEIDRATSGEIRAYLQGASRDGTFNRLHNTLRISQADVRWLRVLQRLLERLGKRSWMYREGTRNVWVIETTWRLEARETVRTPGETAAFVRGYFDAEGGVPTDARARFYIQLVQKNHEDLARTRDLLEKLGVRCGRLHNPSVRQDPGYWRFYCARRVAQAIHSGHRILASPKAHAPRRADDLPERRSGDHAAQRGESLPHPVGTREAPPCTELPCEPMERVMADDLGPRPGDRDYVLGSV